MDYESSLTPFSPLTPPLNQLKKLKRKRLTLAASEDDRNELIVDLKDLVALKDYQSPEDLAVPKDTKDTKGYPGLKRRPMRYDGARPPVFRVAFQMVDYSQIRVPGLKMSTVARMDQKLCRDNFAVIMERMYYRKSKEQQLVEIQFFKKPRSALNGYCLMYGRVMNPIYDLPETLTVYVRLDIQRRTVRVPIDHFRIVN